MENSFQSRFDEAVALFANRDNESDVNKAKALLQNLHAEKPDCAAVIFYLASIEMYRENMNDAEQLLYASLALDDTSKNAALAWNNLGYIEREKGNFDKSLEYYQKAIACHPDVADFWANAGGYYVARGTPDKAIEVLNEAIKRDSNHRVALWNRALAYLEKGDYVQGFGDYDYGDRLDHESGRVRDYGIEGLPDWDGTSGKNIIVYGEQGMGDEIMFASLIPDVMRDCQIILDAHPRLMDIFRVSFPDIPVFGTRKDPMISWPQFYEIDAKISIGSVAKFYRKTESDFPRIPYLKACPKRSEKYKEKLATLSHRPKIGISWRGGILSTNMHERNIPLEKWLPLFEFDADFISLQYNADAGEQVNNFMEKTGKTLHHWQRTIDDYDETAALVSNLDLIISVPQTVVHLAGALGTPTWQLCPKKAMWQMGPYGKDMPWYAYVKNIWQDETGTWEPVIHQVTGALCTYLTNIAN